MMKKQIFSLMKRVMDIVISFLLIILLSPILLIIAIIIKIDSEGPVLFKQKRVGLFGKSFFCYKFRSMVCNADQSKYYEFIRKAINDEYGHGTANNHVEFKTKDSRLTRVGKIIRKSSIDELPQLFNVIKGEMSLIGPRPDVPQSVKYYSDFELKRLKVKPGITGWWQVNGRSNLSLSQMFALDNYYVENQSLFLDIKIFFKTIYVVISMKGSG
jgi:exopolysaccharide biosynthesis polyprenyl glycosylphosphotransferase